MTAEQLRVARKFFRYEIYSRDATAFESFFTDVMSRAYPNFKQVKPQGSIGDRSNDGYKVGEGEYFQVYAPEDIAASVSTAVDKASGAIESLLEYWNQVEPILKYRFCYNDKRKGTFPSIETTLAAIRDKHRIEASTFLSRDLEEVLFGCADDVILDVLNGIPDPGEVDLLDFADLHEVVNHILSLSDRSATTALLKAPDFERKIRFNNLSPEIAQLLDKGSFHIGSLGEYFEAQGPALAGDVRNHLSSLYTEAVTAITDAVENAADERFVYVLDKASPSRGWKYKNAVVVVMSYFFEACDIFESPDATA